MNELPLIEIDPWLNPYNNKITERYKNAQIKEKELIGNGSLIDFANGYLYFGLHRIENNWVFREWAPNATKIYLICQNNSWSENEKYSFNKLSDGIWELIISIDLLTENDIYKLKIFWKGGCGERIPAWTNRVVQDKKTLAFNSQICNFSDEYNWQNDNLRYLPKNPFIYEAHIGMATENEKVGSFEEFRINILPRIKNAGYNVLQLMAIQEHPYYGSFGYHVSSFFASSSRFGTPDELKHLIDDAHGLGILVIMDLVHSHAVKNEVEGLGKYDGTRYQFFHEGPKGEHQAWDSYCFDYSKNEVLHFLLSNLKYWLTQYHFDGFRFDGVTSMLYNDHGLSRAFTNYDMYFDNNQDEAAITYLKLANKLIKQVNPNAIIVAEEMSGYPGMAYPVENGGLGFDYRLAMGIPDYWIKMIKEKSDEAWNVSEIFHQLTNKRAEEKTICYAESHDQALVGDKTIIFRLMDKEMYFAMNKDSQNIVVERGIALHKLIRLITFATQGGGYLNFMGNEFGHPEWVDFPREGNNWSYKYARRQWSLSENKLLRYHYLSDFDRDMLALNNIDTNFLNSYSEIIHANETDQVLAFKRGKLLFVFNINPERSFTDYGIAVNPSKYKLVLCSDNNIYGGFNRVDDKVSYYSQSIRSSAQHYLKLYIPNRTAMVLQQIEIKSVY